MKSKDLNKKITEMRTIEDILETGEDLLVFLGAKRVTNKRLKVKPCGKDSDK